MLDVSRWTPERGEDGATPLDQRPQFGRIGGDGVVPPLERFVDREVLLDDAGAERDGRRAAPRCRGVIAEADRDVECLPPGRHGAQVHVRGGVG